MAGYHHFVSDKMGAVDVENQPIKMVPIEENILWDDVDSCLKSNDTNDLNKLIKKRGVASIWRPKEAPGMKTALHRASELGSIQCMKVLIEASKPNGLSLDSPDADGNTPLFCAVEDLQIESLKVLLSSNVHINARNDHGNSILHKIAYAIASCKDKEKEEKLINCLDIIIDRPDIDLEAHNNSGYTPLLAAATKISSDEGVRRGNKLILFCKKMISKGASLDACEKRGISVRQTLEDRKALPEALMGERRSPPSRPFNSLLLDYLVMCEDGEKISELLSSQTQEEANRASNSYIGSKTVLFYLVDKCDARAVKALLGAGADPWQEQVSGELSLHRALSRGNIENLNLLIDSMKNKKNLRQLDISSQTFGLLKRLLENQRKSSSNAGNSGHLKCLKRMLENDIKINVNDREEGGVSQSILHVAAAFNNQEALRLLLEKGAFLGSRKKCIDGEDRGTILPVLRSETLNKAMDGCISCHNQDYKTDDNNTENLTSPDYTLKLDYKFLIPPNDSDDQCDKNEVKTLMEVSQSRTHRKAIKHPLIQALLYAKWRRVLPLYIVNLSLYLFFVVFLTLFMYSLKDLRIYEERSSRLSAVNATVEEQRANEQYNVGVYMGFLIPLTLYMLFREVFQIIYTYRTYLKNFENYLEWFLIIIVFVLCGAKLGVDLTRHFAAWAMIIAWYEFVLLLGRAPPLAIYVTMLRHVSWNFLKLIFLYGALILAFTVSFNIILQPTKVLEGSETEFDNFWSTLPKAIVMATGEFEYSDLSSNVLSSKIFFATSAILVFLVFLFLIFLVLMNVMNGLAVTDTQQVMEEATLYSLKSRLELVYLIEEMMLVAPCCKKLLSYIHLISGSNSHHLLVKVNNHEKSKRIIFGDPNEKKYSKLDNDTAHILRSYRLQQLELEREQSQTDPMTQCLEMLQEIRNLASQTPHARPLTPDTLSPSSSRGRLN